MLNLLKNRDNFTGSPNESLQYKAATLDYLRSHGFHFAISSAWITAFRDARGHRKANRETRVPAVDRSRK